ncbi:M23 family metallopeptidase [Brachybacterium sp. EF45031]|uniref:M23 family metallopeptidase n=1 Tax=Brachybacterium sillae TaxID=2810536 RepID=UPI00217DF82A|nr:M23 family metallopeptidase [Brachybacterium sillae]MCS6712331.1 M23 family metallopeptidase [Brachybacterium sillae]
MPLTQTCPAPSALVRHLPRRVRPSALLALVVLVACLLPGATVRAAPDVEPGSWSWPLAAPHRVVHPFEAPPTPYAAGHRGADLAGAGVQVRAVDDGVVRFVGQVAGRPVVSIQHAGGLQSTYEPVRSSVQAGQPVRRGDVIGTLDEASTSASHCAPQLCLHLGARLAGGYLDPLLLLGDRRGPSVLLPLDGAGGGPASGAAAGSGAVDRETGEAARAPDGTTTGRRLAASLLGWGALPIDAPDAGP